jgi:hypothetical protein
MACQRNERKQLSRWSANLNFSHKQTIEVGCYICPSCPKGQRWFRLEPPGFEAKSNYTTTTRLALISLVTEYKLSFTGAAAIGRDLFNLPQIVDTTIMRWFRETGELVDYPAHLVRVAKIFSGQLALDEVYDGNYWFIKATDPINNIELSCWMGEGSPSGEDLRDCLLELKAVGIIPTLIVTDGSSLYPKIIKEVWPNVEHQLCVFHFIMGTLKELGKAFWVSYRSMPTPKKRKRGRPKKRGRPRLDKLKRLNRRKVRSIRFLLFKKGGLDERGNPRLSEREEQRITEAIALCPSLGILRRFALSLYNVFGVGSTTYDVAKNRRDAIINDVVFQSCPGLEKSLKKLSNPKLFSKLTRYLGFDNARKTSNHVERENRDFRKRQRSHYRLRSLRSLVAFLDLMLVRRSPPTTPLRLRRRERLSTEIPDREEVLAA